MNNIQKVLLSIEELETMQLHGIKQFTNDNTKYSKISDVSAFFMDTEIGNFKNKNGKTLQEFLNNMEKLFDEGLQTFINAKKEEGNLPL